MLKPCNATNPYPPPLSLYTIIFLCIISMYAINPTRLYCIIIIALNSPIFIKKLRGKKQKESH